jgi:hypothetical protein
MKKRRIFALQVLGEACLGEEALQAPSLLAALPALSLPLSCQTVLWQ